METTAVCVVRCYSLGAGGVVPNNFFSSSSPKQKHPPISSSSSRSTYGVVKSKIRCTNLSTSVSASSSINDVVVTDPAQVQITWQVLVGSLAGVTPFVVAGIEFSKRILAQRRCEVCGGSGLVMRDKDYFKCPGCGGFLPWQSWRRFFTG